MKPLNKYPTPETDKAAAGFTGIELCAAFEVSSRRMEQRLAVCREALEWANAELGKRTKPDRITETLAATAPKL